VLVLCAGDRPVDAERLGLSPATADQVRAVTGFSIGGIPPLGHDKPLPTTIDASLRRFEAVWAAAGAHSKRCGCARREHRGSPNLVPKKEVQPMTNVLPGKRIAFLFTDGVEQVELTEPEHDFNSAHSVDQQGGSGIGVLWDTSTPHTPQSGWGCAELWSSWRARRRPTGGSGPSRSGPGRVDSRPAQAAGAGVGARWPRSWNRTGPRSGEDRCALGLPPQASSAPARVSARRTARVPTQRLKSRAGLTDTPRSAPPEPHD